MSKHENPRTIKGINNSMVSPYHGMIEEIRVVLVDHDNKFVGEMVHLLKSCEYKVMTVGMASTSMAMLSKGKEKINAIIINVHSLDFLSLQLLAQEVALDIFSLFICDEHNEHLVMKSLNIGAYHYLKKPLGEDIVDHLWQFVTTGRIKKQKARKGLEESGGKMNVHEVGIVGDDEEQVGEKNNVLNTEEHSNNTHEAENNAISNEKYKLGKKGDRKSIKEINEGEIQSRSINKTVKRKGRTKWTKDLHAKFMEVVQHLGEGRCYPKDIFEAMNVPGLTRMQVVSHLQKCRNNNWKASKEPKSRYLPSGQGSSSGSQQRYSIRKFGTMPCLQANIPNQIQRGSNHIFSIGESSIQQQLHCPQLQVQSHYLDIGNSFNNPFFFTQNNIGGGTQQHGPLFRMLGSQGLQGPIIENTGYKPELAFNGVGHHSQNDYNLNVNVTTYSSTAMISDIEVGNATVNGLRAENANFPQYFGVTNMSDPSNIITTPDADDSKEKENCDVYFDFDDMHFDLDDMDFLRRNLELPSSDVPDEQSSEFDQVYFDDQVAAIAGVQFSGTANFLDDQVTMIPSDQFQGS